MKITRVERRICVQRNTVPAQNVERQEKHSLIILLTEHFVMMVLLPPPPPLLSPLRKSSLFSRLTLLVVPLLYSLSHVSVEILAHAFFLSDLRFQRGLHFFYK